MILQPSNFSLPILLEQLPATLRTPKTSEVLSGGQSGASLLLLHYGWGDAVMKGPLKTREALFYKEIAPTFRSLSIAVPHVYAMIDHDQSSWVLREAFPQLLPMRRWFGDKTVLHTLHQIHALTTSFTITDPYLPVWEIIDESFSSLLSRDLLERIANLSSRHAQLFLPTTVIIGDPNTTNWGIRADGTVVLFDWEYLGYGTPAHDLGNLIPQLGWPALYEQIATSYLSLTASNPDIKEICQFAHDMAMRRLQSVLEYVNTPEITEDNRHFVLGLLPSWIAMIEQMDRDYHS